MACPSLIEIINGNYLLELSAIYESTCGNSFFESTPLHNPWSKLPDVQLMVVKTRDSPESIELLIMGCDCGLASHLEIKSEPEDE